ncbi:MAG: galactokinase [Acidobacteriota bacterium]|nr:galactokinase [Acidobacteriota bacterium]
MIDTRALLDSFRRSFEKEARLYAAPGRVNLIGEHTDYNEGFVLPMAIDRAAFVAGAVRQDRRVRVHSVNFGEGAEFDLDVEGRGRRGVWLDYIEGVARELEKRGANLRGADLMISSDVPLGAGLSSSAALEVSTGFALLALSGVEIDGKGLALAAQAAEHNYVGAQVGIMDQFTAVMGKRGHALLIDCRSLETTQIPMRASEVVVAICDTRVKHELASSEYNTRRAECERGVEILRGWLPEARALRDVSPEDFERYENQLPEPIRRRCRHVVTENARTLLAASALREGRTEEMGRLMFLSHASLRDDYEVSCAELDAMVEISSRIKGVLGARMTGGGFGGCTVNLVERRALDEFRREIESGYRRATGLEPFIYIAEASDGAKEIKN